MRMHFKITSWQQHTALEIAFGTENTLIPSPFFVALVAFNMDDKQNEFRFKHAAVILSVSDS